MGFRRDGPFESVGGSVVVPASNSRRPRSNGGSGSVGPAASAASNSSSAFSTRRPAPAPGPLHPVLAGVRPDPQGVPRINRGLLKPSGYEQGVAPHVVDGVGVESEADCFVGGIQGLGPSAQPPGGLTTGSGESRPSVGPAQSPGRCPPAPPRIGPRSGGSSTAPEQWGGLAADAHCPLEVVQSRVRLAQLGRGPGRATPSPRPDRPRPAWPGHTTGWRPAGAARPAPWLPGPAGPGRAELRRARGPAATSRSFVAPTLGHGTTCVGRATSSPSGPGSA